MVTVRRGMLRGKSDIKTPNGVELSDYFLPEVGGINISHPLRQIVVESPEYFQNAVVMANQFERQFRESGLYSQDNIPRYMVIPLFPLEQVGLQEGMKRDFMNVAHYPVTIDDPDIGMFFLKCGLDLEHYLESQLDMVELHRDFSPLAVHHFGVLIETLARDYFESRNCGMEIPVERNRLDYLKDFFTRSSDKRKIKGEMKADESMLQFYFTGKDLQKIDGLSQERLFLLKNFAFESALSYLGDGSYLNDCLQYNFPKYALDMVNEAMPKNKN